MPIKKQRIDSEYTRLLGNHMMNAKGFYDYGVKRGLTTPEAMRLTVAKRRETAKALVDSGMSRRRVAKTLGVNRETIRLDVGGSRSLKSDNKVVKNGNKVVKGNGRKKPENIPTSEAELVTGVIATSALQALFDKADANGGTIYFEVNGYGIRVKRLTC